MRNSLCSLLCASVLFLDSSPLKAVSKISRNGIFYAFLSRKEMLKYVIK
jgi:hypothetical protein